MLEVGLSKRSYFFLYNLSSELSSGARETYCMKIEENRNRVTENEFWCIFSSRNKLWWVAS